MTEELDIGKLLGMLEAAPELTPLQRAIVTTDGTVQTMLSVVFKSEVIAKVIGQLTVGDVIVRWTRLIVKDTGRVVCLAESVFSRKDNLSQFIDEIDSRELGIGQILRKHNIMTKRIIIGVFCDDNWFTRTYRIKGSVTDIYITEVFPTRAYEGLQ